MRTLLRLALAVVAAILACAGFGGGAFLWLRNDAEAARDARIAALDAELPAVRAHDTLSPAEACALVEHHVLTRPIDRALAVTCDTPTLEPRGPRSARLDGLVWGHDLDNALFGGGFAQKFCLARTSSGWEVVGDDWHVPECAYEVTDGASAASLAQGAQAGHDARERETALRTLDAVRAALAGGGAVPDTCAGLPPEDGYTVTVTDAALAGRAVPEDAPRGLASSFGYGTNGCAPGAEGMCGLRAPPARVLVVDDLAEDPPIVEGVDAFRGGTFRATFRVVDLAAGRVACAREVAFALPETVVTFKSSSVSSEYERGVKAAVCDTVGTLGGGALRIDPWWGCDR